MLSKFAIIALVPTITPILAQHTFKAYSDPFCTKPLKVLSGGDEVKDGTLVAKKGISSDGGFPGTAYEELTFPDAETQPVYWKSAVSVSEWNAYHLRKSY
jgi:hypothetical protein